MHEPVRTCVGCRQRAAKHDLLRVVAVARESGWSATPDPRRMQPGRGAHLHPDLDCLDLALRRRAFPRALRVREGLATDLVVEHVSRIAPQK